MDEPHLQQVHSSKTRLAARSTRSTLLAASGCALQRGPSALLAAYAPVHRSTARRHGACAAQRSAACSRHGPRLLVAFPELLAVRLHPPVVVGIARLRIAICRHLSGSHVAGSGLNRGLNSAYLSYSSPRGTSYQGLSLCRVGQRRASWLLLSGDRCPWLCSQCPVPTCCSRTTAPLRTRVPREQALTVLSGLISPRITCDVPWLQQDLLVESQALRLTGKVEPASGSLLTVLTAQD